MKKAQIKNFNDKSRVKMLFDDTNKIEIFYADHNPFLHQTEYEMHITMKDEIHKELVQKYQHGARMIFKLFITVEWGENGYKYLTKQRIGNMIKKQFPELLC